MAADARRRAERIAAVRAMLSEWTSDGGVWSVTRRDALRLLADMDAEKADAVAQAIEEERIRHGECHDCYVKKAGL
jgi:hypothetical protein